MPLPIFAKGPEVSFKCTQQIHKIFGTETERDNFFIGHLFPDCLALIDAKSCDFRNLVLLFLSRATICVFWPLTNLYTAANTLYLR